LLKQPAKAPAQRFTDICSVELHIEEQVLLCKALESCRAHHQVSTNAAHLAYNEEVVNKGDLLTAAATTVCCMN